MVLCSIKSKFKTLKHQKLISDEDMKYSTKDEKKTKNLYELFYEFKKDSSKILLTEFIKGIMINSILEIILRDYESWFRNND
jgi:hypothetical protein